jgi:hypothetical protein
MKPGTPNSNEMSVMRFMLAPTRKYAIRLSDRSSDLPRLVLHQRRQRLHDDQVKAKIDAWKEANQDKLIN